HHAGAGGARLEGGGQAGRAGTDDQDVGVVHRAVSRWGRGRRTCMSGWTRVMHARCPGRSSTVTRHSKHMPMTHTRPRGSPRWRLQRKMAWPAPSKAAAMVWPGRAAMRTSSTYTEIT